MTNLPQDMRDLLVRIDARTDNIEKKMDRFEERVDSNETKLAALDTKVTALETKRDTAMEDWKHWRGNVNMAIQNVPTLQLVQSLQSAVHGLEEAVKKLVSWKDETEGHQKGTSKTVHIMYLSLMLVAAIAGAVAKALL